MDIAGLRALISEEDDIDTVIEQAVASSKRARSEDASPTALPASGIQLRVEPTPHSPFPRRMTMFVTAQAGQVFIDLRFHEAPRLVLRKFHIQHSGHTNPNSTHAGRIHMHFPTKQYPLAQGGQRASWA